MNDLEKYFWENKGRLIHKWVHYFDAYDNHFSRYRNKNVTILEIGVSHGGSLQMWKNYFGPGAKIYGIDVDEKCKYLVEDNIKIFIGSQSDRNFLREIKTLIPKVDILIDDGGHTMEQQIVSYEELIDHVKADGVYLCEDVHTSYWSEFGGGYKNPGTFIEYSKNFINYLNIANTSQKEPRAVEFSNTINSIHYYDSIVVLEKAPAEKRIDTGKMEIEYLNNLFLNNKNKAVSILLVDFSNKELQKWRNHFGPDANIYGTTENENYKILKEENLVIFVGSLINKTFLKGLKKTIPPVDILIDCGHSPQIQITTFDELFKHIKPNGAYLSESREISYSGKQTESFIEYSKDFIDYLNAYHSQVKELKVSDFTNSVSSIHYYNGLTIIQKNIRKEKPHHEKTGVASFERKKLSKYAKLKRLFTGK